MASANVPPALQCSGRPLVGSFPCSLEGQSCVAIRAVDMCWCHRSSAWRYGGPGQQWRAPGWDDNGATDPCKNEPLAPVLSAFFQGPYLPGEAARSMPISGVPAGPFQSLRYQSPWLCLCGGAEHRGTMEEIIQHMTSTQHPQRWK